jgi:AcrR family transcriptional regulator
MHSQIIVDDLNFILFAKEYVRFSEIKAQQKAFIIIERAIQCFAKKGFEQVTLEMIAREVGVSRTSIKYYFKDLEEIILFSLKHIRVSAQKVAVKALEGEQNPREMLAKYVFACLQWAQSHRTHAMVWLSFIHRCGRDKKYRNLNTESVQVGTSRIQSILNLGQAAQIFQCTDSLESARLIQITITGALCTLASENLNNESEFVSMIVQQCLKVAEGR